MGIFMGADCALLRLVENDAAPIMQRVRALELVNHPPLALMRRLLVETKTRKKPVPAKLAAVATLKYAQEIHLRKLRKEQRVQSKKQSDNALGI